jgi:hypothetical protein
MLKMTNPVKGSALEREAIDQLAAVLRKVPFLQSARFRE